LKGLRKEKPYQDHGRYDGKHTAGGGHYSEKYLSVILNASKMPKKQKLPCIKIS